MSLPLLPGVRPNALLSEDGVYRYWLSRTWSPAPVVLWIMLNPSTATAHEDDNTIRKCQKFARSWGYGGIYVANIFALRSRDPRALLEHPDPIGPENDRRLLELANVQGSLPGLNSGQTFPIIAAWGAHGLIGGRGPEVRRMFQEAGRKLYYLRLTKSGHPWHPLYLPDSSTPVEWTP